MNQEDSYQDLQDQTNKKAEQREKRRKPKMKVSGKSVFELQRMMQKPSEPLEDTGEDEQNKK